MTTTLNPAIGSSPDVYVAGSADGTQPTDTEKGQFAYVKRCKVNGSTLTLYASSKPSSTFYIWVEGVNGTGSGDIVGNVIQPNGESSGGGSLKSNYLLFRVSNTEVSSFMQVKYGTILTTGSYLHVYYKSGSGSWTLIDELVSNDGRTLTIPTGATEVLLIWTNKRVNTSAVLADCWSLVVPLVMSKLYQFAPVIDYYYS